jgi:two-component system, OmpR family, sensor histidine kinase BaeS
MRQSLKTRLFSAFALVVLVTVGLISVLANVLIGNRFTDYRARQQEQKTQEITTIISQQYSSSAGAWDIPAIHALGMSVLYDGYVIKVNDTDGSVIWDAQTHDMGLCAKIMDDIFERMSKLYPKMKGGFSTKVLSMTRDDTALGTVNIMYYGPFFLTEEDNLFLGSLNTVTLLVGVLSLIAAAVVGAVLARRLSQPILTTADAAKQISDGHYGVRINEKANTKELNLLMSSINHLAQVLERQGNLRKKLTEDVSHELRTPISIVQLHIDAMIDGVWELSVDKLKTCRDELDRMEKLVGDIANLSEAEQEDLQLNKTQTDLMELMQKAADSFAAEIKNKGLHMKVYGRPVMIFADRDRISQVLWNLLSNAVKYTEAGGHIGMEISETAESAVLKISDDGIGIAREDQPLIFERLYRTDRSRSRNTGGAGIGLAIVKSIVEAHGGTVAVESEPGKGSCFEIILPKE